MWQESILIYCWWKCKLVQLLSKTVWRLLRKTDLPYDPAISLLRMYPNKIKSVYRKAICTPMAIAAQFTTAKMQNQPNVHQLTTR